MINIPIPKTIHYCWFGGNEKSELINTCIDSWKRFLPDYEIKEWNESNFDVESCDYVKEAYGYHKWAFVSDYCRVWVLYKYGGVYFDTDVEIIRESDFFNYPTIAFENDKILNPGLVLASEKEDWFCREMLDSYQNDHFLVDGKMNFNTICTRATEIFERKGLIVNNTCQQVEGYKVYSSEYFNPKFGSKKGIDITHNTIAIHNFEGSWVDREAIKFFKLNWKGRLVYMLQNVIGKNATNRILKFMKEGRMWFKKQQ